MPKVISSLAPLILCIASACGDAPSPPVPPQGPVNVPVNVYGGVDRDNDRGFFIQIDGDRVEKWGDFRSVRPFRNGRATVVMHDGSECIAKPDGEVVCNSFARVSHYRGDLAAAHDAETQLWGIIDKQAQYVVPPRWQAVMWVENLVPAAFVKDPVAVGFREPGNDLWGVADLTGRTVVEPRFAFMYPFQDGFARVRVNEGDKRHAFIDATGSRVFGKAFDSAGSFSEGRATFHDDEADLGGYIDTTGNVAIAPQWERASPFVDDRAVVMTPDNKWSMIDRAGNVVAHLPYRLVMWFEGGAAAVQGRRGLWGYIDRSGNEIIEPQFDRANGFHNGYAHVVRKLDNLIINGQGAVIWSDANGD